MTSLRRAPHWLFSLVALVSLAGCGASHAADDAGDPADAPTPSADAHAPGTDAPLLVDAGPGTDAPTEDAPRPRVDLVIELRGFDAYDGARATVHATDTSIGERHGPASATLVGGDADLVIEGGFVRDLFGELGQLWIDTNADGACTDGTDPAFGFFINNDFETGPERVTVTFGDPMLSSTTCSEAQ
jgi:hypothetical protein